MLQTSANSTLGVTFNDATTFNLTANATITIDNYVYEDGGKQNAALFDIAKGTVAFVAAEVAHTGDMKISTPTATLGIRGTTGLVEVPEGAAANNPNNVAIKLYPDADGRVGRIEVNDRSGARLGFLTQGSSGFTIRPGAGGRFTAAPLAISPQQALRDQGIVRQVHAAQSVGRQIVSQQRALRQANPNRNNPTQQSSPRNNPGQRNNPNLRNNNPAGAPGQQRQNGQPARPDSRKHRHARSPGPGASRNPACSNRRAHPAPNAPACRNRDCSGPACNAPASPTPGASSAARAARRAEDSPRTGVTDKERSRCPDAVQRSRCAVEPGCYSGKVYFAAYLVRPGSAAHARCKRNALAPQSGKRSGRAAQPVADFSHQATRALIRVFGHRVGRVRRREFGLRTFRRGRLWLR